MLITVLVLSGTILGATAIAGLLMVYQLRQSNDVINSNKAIFAADSGIEWRLYKFFKADSQICKECPDGGVCPGPNFENGASFQTTCELLGGGAVPTVKVKSTGTAGNNSRAFEIILQ
ncbi:MAG: hypothetical protein HYY86_02485 [Candidatus Harrisonbacteria bacterium]|nr:hypothetical protein [Candidatus Harrisonbacteria bacterium]